MKIGLCEMTRIIRLFGSLLSLPSQLSNIQNSSNNSTTGSSTSSPGTTAAAAKNTLAFTQAARVGKYPLNKTATKEFAALAQGQASPIAAEIKANGAGSPGSDVVALYDLSSVTSVTSSAYTGIAFVGYDGAFSPTAVIKIERTKLKSSRIVKAGPNGGEMICGYNTSTGSDASECVWVTKSTWGQVLFIADGAPVKFPGAAALALKVRSAVEVHAS